uniref:Ubiquitin carboxyl-terminal hydrolase n=1 Tax=Bursaphelenchus xylophilus TaxID=6326 RepID=A0A1I7RX31_BURXY
MTTQWLPLESNPDVFNDFIQKIGISGAKCVDVYGFDDELLAFIPKPHLALILCYPDYKKVDEIMKPVYDKLAAEGTTVPENVFFMKQKISNACGTFALFHSIAQNTDKLNIGQGSFAKWFAEAKKVGVDERSDLLAKSEDISQSHEASAASGETDANPDTVEHHFIAYCNINGTLYEIDSRQPFPRACGPTTQDNLLKDAGTAAKELMDKLGNVSFSALALVGDS